MATVTRVLMAMACWLAVPHVYGDGPPRRLIASETATDYLLHTPLALLETREIPNPLILQQNRTKIGKIVINRGNVFDLSKPEEDIALFRLANRLHIMTRDSVIRNQLLFEPGDYFSRRALRESERILRANGYLYDAEIHVAAYHEETNTVDIEVNTRDAWTFEGSISFGREGGSNSISTEIQESNLLGYGKDLRFQASSDIDRKEALFQYSDNHVWGTQNKMSVLFNNKSDGVTKAFEFERPFFSITTEWSLGFSTLRDERVDSVYEFGEVLDQFNHNSRRMSLFWGLSRRQYDNLVYRWRFGFSNAIDEFETTEDYPGAALPDDRDRRYPWASLEIYEDEIIRTTRIHQIRRTEDLNLGNEIHARIGWSDPVFTAEDEGVIFNVNANTAFQLFEEQVLLFNPYTSGFITDGRAENTRVGFSTRYYKPNFHQQVFYMAFSAQFAKNVYRDEQLLLGGDSGLRGYPLRFQTGDRKFLFTMEQRFYTTWHWFELAYVGAVAFFDIGRAWTPGAEETENTGILKDAGIGLRLASSRGARGVILHIDLAFALDGTDDIDNSQLVITTKETF